MAIARGVVSRGSLTLSCGDEAFARIRSAVVEAAGEGVRIEGQPDEVRVIPVAKIPPPRPPARFRDKLPMVGCALVGLAFLFVLVVGVRAIAGWAR